MTKKRLILIGGICLALILVLTLICGCTQPATTGTPTTKTATSTTTVTAPAKTITVTAGPEEPEVIKWRMQTGYGPTTALWTDVIVPFCEDIKSASGGRLVITPYVSGTLCPDSDAFTSVASGTIEAAASFPTYMMGFMPETALSDTPFMLRTLSDVLEVQYHLGFEDFMRESYAANGVHLMGLMATPSLYMMSTKEINSVEDIVGLKVRTVGALAIFFDALNASTVYIPGSEVYTALATGTVEAATWGTPEENLALGWHEVAKYIVKPAVEPATLGMKDLYVNLDVWNELPSDLQTIVGVCAEAANTRAWHVCTHADSLALEEMQAAGVNFCSIPAEEYPILAEAASSAWDDMASKSGRAKAAVKIITDYMRSQGYTDYQVD